MHVALADAGGRDANELGFALQRRNVPAPAVPHARAEASDQLIDQAGDAAFVGHASFDPFGDELVGPARRVEVELVLEIAVPAPAAHRSDGAHPAILFEAPALIQNQ